jgi:prepilin-type N-terminal cleavage/methylation domain-containing protein
MEQQMTSSLRRNSLRRNSFRGFTLIELLVVIGIIVLLATIVLPMISQAHKQAIRVSMAADLQVIGQALEAYKHDFGDYPRPDRNQINDNPNLPFVTGAALLCWALVAPGPANSQQVGPSISPGDGADGPGFRVRGTIGAVKGPYLPPDRFLIGTADSMGVVHAPKLLDNAQDVLADRNSSPILYFAATPGAVATSSPNGFVEDQLPPHKPGEAPIDSSLFTFDDNAIYLAPARGPGGGASNPANLTRGGWQVMSYRLGDSNINGVIDPGEVPITTGPYLLWSAGPDGIFGNDDDVMSDGTQLQQVTGTLPPTIRLQ